MAIKELISLLYTIGNIAIIAAMLTMVGTVFLLIRYKPWQLRSALRSEEQPKSRPTEQVTVTSQAAETEDEFPPPREPSVTVIMPEETLLRIKQIWETTPAMPAGWNIGGK